MESLRITGQRPISGEVEISGNKNAVLPMIPALLLTDEECVLHNVPDIRDVRSMLTIAGELGAEFTFETLCASSAAIYARQQFQRSFAQKTAPASSLPLRLLQGAEKLNSILRAEMSSADAGSMVTFTD